MKRLNAATQQLKTGFAGRRPKRPSSDLRLQTAVGPKKLWNPFRIQHVILPPFVVEYNNSRSLAFACLPAA